MRELKAKSPKVRSHDEGGLSIPTGFYDTSSIRQDVPMLVIPVMAFDTKFHDFGTIKKGEITPVFTYNFTNRGNIPLDIDQVSGCDCSEFDWTRTTVAPNEKGFISVKFNSNKAEPEESKKKLEKFLDIVLKQKHPKTGYVIVVPIRFNVFIAD